MDTIFDLEKDDISAMDISLGDAISLRKLKKNKDNLLDVVEKTVPKDNYESQTALNDQLTPTPTPLNRTSPVLFQDDIPHEQESTTPSSSQITSPPYSLMTPSPIKKRKTITYDHPEIEVSTTSSSSQITSPPYSLMTPSPIKKSKVRTYDHPEIEVSTGKLFAEGIECFLKNSHSGQAVLSEKGKLSDNARNHLCRLVMEYLLVAGIRTD